ncbi:MAG: MraY family glycosyltransferase [Candidatus Omnitrophica bacterium]|nr:MraY family glycosyltransferase [Candidatus Omnitrophota bacterium]
MNMSIINALIIILGAFLTGTLLLFFLKGISQKYKLLIAQEIPLVGGISLATAFILTSFCFIYLNGLATRETFGLIFASLLMLAFGVIDDWRELSVGVKFLLQIIGALILVFFGIKTQIIFIGSALNIIITIIWVLAITNAFNHLDIMDGVAALTGLIVSVAFFLIAFFGHDLRSMIFSLALIASILSFLLYNLPPAKVYMGNAGSHFLGFLLAAISLMMSFAPMEKKIALVSPVLILGFPIYDTLFLILMRLLKKKVPFKKSNDHLVLRCLVMGYSKKKALYFTLFWNLFFVFAGMITYFASYRQGITTVIIVVLVGLGLAKTMSKVRIND